MSEFGDKYDGDIQSALRGLQKERLALDVAPIDRNAMKRKWAPATEDENETRTDNPGKHSRAAKNREWFLSPVSPNDVYDQRRTKARIAPPSPQKKPPFPGSGPPPRVHVPKTPGTVRSFPHCRTVSFMHTTSHMSSEPPPHQPQARVNSPAYPRISSRAQHRPPNLLRLRSPAMSAYPRPRPSSPRFPRHPRTLHAGRAGTKVCSASTAHH
jgi:hypothetical protein